MTDSAQARAADQLVRLLDSSPHLPQERLLELTLSERLHISRRRSGLDIPQIAELLGVHRNSVSSWEHDKAKPPRTALIVWAQLTGCPFAWLVGGEYSGDTSHYFAGDAATRADAPTSTDTGAGLDAEQTTVVYLDAFHATSCDPGDVDVDLTTMVYPGALRVISAHEDADVPSDSTSRIDTPQTGRSVLLRSRAHRSTIDDAAHAFVRDGEAIGAVGGAR